MHKIIHINNKTYKKITKVYLTILFKKNNNKISFSIIKYVLYIKLNKCMDFHYNVEDYKLILLSSYMNNYMFSFLYIKNIKKTKKNKIKQKIKQKK
ncbi:hypothetical protein PFAG_01060 [Plasmodium falciparum Santa Lucia]|uniref:Uncharacterized protein n=2 Tax=Plasmodium falciparum TaxID=5833 RepID=A0A024XD55_PLAFC|nr:hypothetical protein PFMC_01120 [Plasmodium falciparum CAMP/Malaysia]EUT90703.1 hypothetical protein PFAG_01060 [Plasmodium falciparum Santa Lucia]